MSVERHLEDRGDAAARRASSAGLPALPLGAARLVEVDVAVDHAGEHGQTPGIDDCCAIRDLTADGGDDAIGDGDVGGLLASREDDRTAPYDDRVAHPTSSITISCAPFPSVRLAIFRDPESTRLD